jgi:hypothetical protein
MTLHIGRILESLEYVLWLTADMEADPINVVNPATGIV